MNKRHFLQLLSAAPFFMAHAALSGASEGRCSRGTADIGATVSKLVRRPPERWTQEEQRIIRAYTGTRTSTESFLKLVRKEQDILVGPILDTMRDISDRALYDAKELLVGKNSDRLLSTNLESFNNLPEAYWSLATQFFALAKDAREKLIDRQTDFAAFHDFITNERYLTEQGINRLNQQTIDAIDKIRAPGPVCAPSGTFVFTI